MWLAPARTMRGIQWSMCVLVLACALIGACSVEQSECLFSVKAQESVTVSVSSQCKAVGVDAWNSSNANVVALGLSRAFALYNTDTEAMIALPSQAFGACSQTRCEANAAIVHGGHAYFGFWNAEYPTWQRAGVVLRVPLARFGDGPDATLRLSDTAGTITAGAVDARTELAYFVCAGGSAFEASLVIVDLISFRMLRQVYLGSDVFPLSVTLSGPFAWIGANHGQIIAVDLEDNDRVISLPCTSSMDKEDDMETTIAAPARAARSFSSALVQHFLDPEVISFSYLKGESCVYGLHGGRPALISQWALGENVRGGAMIRFDNDNTDQEAKRTVAWVGYNSFGLVDVHSGDRVSNVIAANDLSPRPQQVVGTCMWSSPDTASLYLAVQSSAYNFTVYPFSYVDN